MPGPGGVLAVAPVQLGVVEQEPDFGQTLGGRAGEVGFAGRLGVVDSRDFGIGQGAGISGEIVNLAAERLGAKLGVPAEGLGGDNPAAVSTFIR